MQAISLNTWIVEDDPTYQTLLQEYLKLLGHKTRIFFGDDCLLHLNSKPDVVILDHHLGKDIIGIDILCRIKNEHPNTFVIYLSGQEKISVVADAQRHGSDDYIGKDSASLLRLKVKLEKILHLKSLKLKKKKLRARFLKLGLIVGTLLAGGLFYWLRQM